MLGEQKQNERRTYLSINHGKVVQGSGDAKTLFSFVEGTLKGIYTRNTKFGNEEVTRWYIDMKDGEDIYSVCLPYASGVFKSIILALASKEDLSPSTLVKLQPYEGKNGFTKVSVYADGARLDWVTKELPPIETVTIGGRTVKDDTKQMELINSLCDKVRERLRNNN